MWDWYLGQAGFGEQIQLYGDTFWRQLGTTLLWTFLAVWAVLMLAVIFVTLFRRAAASAETRDRTGIGKVPERVPTRALVPYTGPARHARPWPEEKAPSKVA
jgi:hypothetical protein